MSTSGSMFSLALPMFTRGFDLIQAVLAARRIDLFRYTPLLLLSILTLEQLFTNMYENNCWEYKKYPLAISKLSPFIFVGEQLRKTMKPMIIKAPIILVRI